MTVSEQKSEKQTLGFQAEVKQLLQLMIHSLYSNKEIFLRELISNASDAADKLRFEAINNAALYESDPELKIRVTFDAAARTITIADNGIGMSREEAVEHLGTIAKSGTREFFSKLSGDQQKDAALIGQFGVGFYSAFIVADRITVESRRAGAAAGAGVRWESSGSGEYSLQAIELTRRGTTVTLQLKDGEDEFLDAWKLRDLVKRYSDHVAFPIRMPLQKDGKPTDEWETVNHAAALWTRPKAEIEDAEYQVFVQFLFGYPKQRIQAVRRSGRKARHMRAILQRLPHSGCRITVATLAHDLLHELGFCQSVSSSGKAILPKAERKCE